MIAMAERHAAGLVLALAPIRAGKPQDATVDVPAQHGLR
jgi:hypothetical protein